MWLIFIGIIVLIYLVSSNRPIDDTKVENPTGRLTSIKFDRHLKYGDLVPMSETFKAPDIRFNGTPSTLYTLIMFDADAPNPDNPYEADYLHWSIVNIQAGQPIESGLTVTPYLGLNPPIGTHRYFIQLYEQANKIESSENDENRINWNLEQFTTIHSLKKKGEFMFKVKSETI